LLKLAKTLAIKRLNAYDKKILTERRALRRTLSLPWVNFSNMFTHSFYPRRFRKSTKRQSSHQVSISLTFNLRVFHSNVMFAAFFYVCTYIKKAAETTFVQKRSFNVDEIDTRLWIQILHHSTFTNWILVIWDFYTAE